MNDNKQMLNSTSSDLELAKIAMGENYDKPSGRKQSFCEVGSFNVSP